MKTQIDPIRIDHTGIYLGDKAIPGVIRWTARHEPDRGVFELQLTLVTSACHVSLDAPAGQILGGPVGQQARAGVAASIEKIRTNTMIGSYNAPAPAAPTAAPSVEAVRAGFAAVENKLRELSKISDEDLAGALAQMSPNDIAQIMAMAALATAPQAAQPAAPSPQDAAEPAGGAK